MFIHLTTIIPLPLVRGEGELAPLLSSKRVIFEWSKSCSLYPLALAYFPVSLANYELGAAENHALWAFATS